VRHRLHLDLGEEPDPLVGYLTDVLFLEQVPLPVQVGLMVDGWARRRTLGYPCSDLTGIPAAQIAGAAPESLATKLGDVLAVTPVACGFRVLCGL